MWRDDDLCTSNGWQLTCGMQGSWKSHMNIYIYIYICIYIYIYIRAIIVVRRWTIHCACQRKCKNESYQKSKKLKAGFFQATWLVPPGQTIWNKCVFRCDFNCSLATVISVQLQSTEHWHYPRLSVQCFQRCVHVQGTLSSHPQPHPTPPPTMISVATQNKWRRIKDVYMCKERYHPIPNPTPPHPPHFGHRRTTTIAGIYIYIDVLWCVHQRNTHWYFLDFWEVGND